MKNNSTESSGVSKDLTVTKQHEISVIFDENIDTAFIDGEFESSFEDHQKNDIPDDKVEISSDVVSAIGGGAVGAAAAGSIATAAGASTLLGSTSLASVLGGVFVTTTPIGWVVGAAVAAGAASYGIGKLIKSINKDNVRDEYSKKLEIRILDLKSLGNNELQIIELKNLLLSAIENKQISELKAIDIVSQIESGSLSVESAIERINTLII